MSSTKEKIKTILICLLLVGMVYLTYAVWFYDSPYGKISLKSLFDYSVQEDVGEGENSDLDRFGIRPLAITVSDENGRRGAVNSSSMRDAIYNAVRPDIARCIKSANKLEEVSNAEWEEALLTGGVFMDYRADVPVSAIWMWLGSNLSGESLYGRYYIFSTEKRNITVYVKNAGSGKVYSVQTDASSETLRDTISKTEGDKVYFALEREEKEFRAIMQEMVITENQTSLPILAAYNSVTNFSETTAASALEVFGLSDVAPTRYAEQDGSEVYIADRVTLKISPTGIMTYTDTREEADETLGLIVESDGDIPTLAEKTEAARALVAAFSANLPGEGGIYIAAVSEGAFGTEIIFGRHIDGVPVDMRETVYFANILIKGKSVRSAKFNLYAYDKTAKTSDAVPERIAAAAVLGGGKTGDVNLRYLDRGEDEVSFAWYVGGIEKEDKKEA